MAKGKRKGHKMPGYRKVVKKVAGFGSAAVISAPIWLPMYEGLNGVMHGQNAKDATTVAIKSATGFNIQTNEFAPHGVIVRDAVLIGMGLGLRWAAKRV